MDHSTEYQVRNNSMPSSTNVHMDTARGYMILRHDYTCGPNVKFIIGGTYQYRIHPCFEKRGFYFCKSLASCFVCKPEFDVKNRIVEVESVDGYIENERLYAAHQIKVIRELTWEDAIAELRSKQAPSRISRTEATTAQEPRTGTAANIASSESHRQTRSECLLAAEKKNQQLEELENFQKNTQQIHTLVQMLQFVTKSHSNHA